jgi:hypothetical protein
MDIQHLKTMIKEPASKEWFNKHGNPKSKALHKAASPKLSAREKHNLTIFRMRQHEKERGKLKDSSVSAAPTFDKIMSKKYK